MNRKIRLRICCISIMIFFCGVSIKYVGAAESTYVSSYSEYNIQEMRTYKDTITHIVQFVDEDTGEISAEGEVTINYEYSDGNWAELYNVYLNIECYDGYSVSVDENKEMYHGYVIRYCTIKSPNGLCIKYEIKAYADSYGDTGVNWQIIDRYYD